ncbi:MAG: metallophosphoesterase [Planctomycetia bacterium]|nr:metallophosphoesterase [Planctomycetia bacterium]
MIKFGVLTDIQYADKDNRNNRDYRASLEKFLEASAVFSSEKASFILQLGDVIDEEWQNFSVMIDLWEKTTSIPFRHVLGNHDLLVDNALKEKVYSSLNLPKPAYSSFILNDSTNPKNNWRFIILDGNEIALYSAINSSEKEKAEEIRKKFKLANGKLPEEWNGAVSQTQLDWLKDQLTEAEKESQYVAICSHFPLFFQINSYIDNDKLSNLPVVKDIGLYLFEMGVSTWNGRAILDILDQFSCVKVYFAGHLHEGGYGNRKNVHHLTFRGMVEASPNAYSILELDRNNIVVHGYGTEPSAVYQIQ